MVAEGDNDDDSNGARISELEDESRAQTTLEQALELEGGVIFIMGRRANFTVTEKNIFIDLMNKPNYISVIECKKTDSKSLESKSTAWKELCAEFISSKISSASISEQKAIKKIVFKFVGK
ncbi:uncharacterized protein LOC143459259 isoform X2 [Clavelina lepadiformis]